MRPLLEERTCAARRPERRCTSCRTPVMALCPAAEATLERYAAGVAAHRLPHGRAAHDRMARVGQRITLDNLADPAASSRACTSPVTSPSSARARPADSATLLHDPRERTHLCTSGSSYGGNALLGKIAHGLRQAAYDGWASGEFHRQQFHACQSALLDKLTGPAQASHRRHLSAVSGERFGQDEPRELMHRARRAPDPVPRVDFYGDDIAWLRRVDPNEQPESTRSTRSSACFGRREGPSEVTNPNRPARMAPGHAARLIHQRGLQRPQPVGCQKSAYPVSCGNDQR